MLCHKYYVRIKNNINRVYPVFTAAILELAKRHGVDTDYDTAYKLLKQSTTVALKYYDFGISLAEAREEFESIYCSIAPTTQELFPGAKAILEYAREQGKKCYVYTHSDKWVYGLLERMQIKDCFEFILDRSYDFPAKPNPTALNFLCEECGIDKSCALMVGDRNIDIDVANNAGIAACLFDGEEFYPSIQAEYRIKNLFELKDII